jgi:hypothetical protein
VKPNKKQKAEFKLLDELQKNHGYMIREVPKGQRVVLISIREKKAIEPGRVCKLVVPGDSALAIALAESSLLTWAAQSAARPKAVGKKTR